MTTRIDILSTSLEYSERLEQARLRQEQRGAPATALASLSGFLRAFSPMTGHSMR
jgi:hypothetical protein